MDIFSEEGKEALAKAYCNFIKSKEVVHNVIVQAETPEESLIYEDKEAQWLAMKIARATKATCHSQLFVLQKAVKIWS